MFHQLKPAVVEVTTADKQTIYHQLVDAFNEQLEGQFQDFDHPIRLVVHTKNGDVKVSAYWSDQLINYADKIQKRNMVTA